MFTVLPSGCSAAPPRFEAIVCCGECEDADTMCDGCLSLALLPLPFYCCLFGCESLFNASSLNEKNPWWLCAIISKNGYLPGS